MTMQLRKYQLEFLTPAFLGNAVQNAQWRTPPLKAALRHWWRVAYAASQGYAVSVAKMRQAEDALFGSAASGEGGSSRRSRLRLRLDRWTLGKLRKAQWRELSKVPHPEVQREVDSGLYLGYGPIELPRGQREPTLKAEVAIAAGEQATLALAFPASESAQLDRAVALFHRYGTVGGRARNGWGSVALAGEGSLLTGEADLHLRDWRDCLDRDYPHAIGRDERGPLIWQTEAQSEWQAVMHDLAEIKIALRTSFPFRSGNQAPEPEERHWLAYPVTKHSVSRWRNARLPNSLRFKVRRDRDGRLRGIIAHLPCLPPKEPFGPDPRAVERIWAAVYQRLDGNGKIERIPA